MKFPEQRVIKLRVEHGAMTASNFIRIGIREIFKVDIEELNKALHSRKISLEFRVTNPYNGDFLHGRIFENRLVYHMHCGAFSINHLLAGNLCDIILIFKDKSSRKASPVTLKRKYYAKVKVNPFEIKIFYP